MKKIKLFFFTLLFSVCFSNVKAQLLPDAPIPGGFTVDNINQKAQELINNMRKSAEIVGSTEGIVIEGNISSINDILNKFDADAGSDITKSINSLSDDAQNLANQLFSLSNRINSILNQQQICLTLNAQTVIAGIQTVLSQVKILGFHPIKTSRAGLNYFQFLNHSPYLIPEEGGDLQVFGINLWNSQSAPPVVKLVTMDNKVLANLKAARSNSNSFFVTIDSTTIKKFSGINLLINVEPFKDILGIKESLGIYNMPFCIPSSFKSKIKIIAHLSYQTDTTKIITLDYKPFEFSNTVCTDVKPIPKSICWDIKPNDDIIDIAKKNEMNQGINNHVAWSAKGNCIVTSGYLEPATCGDSTIIRSYWYAEMAPIIRQHTIIDRTSEAISPLVQLNNHTTEICVDIAKISNNLNTDIFWFEIVQINGGKTETIYTSEKKTGSCHADYNGLSIDATLNARPINRMAQICVTLTKPQCGL